MVSTGDPAPTFSATVGTSDHEDVHLDDHLGDGPVVLAFFPGAFTPPCTNEMVALQERVDDFEGAGATLLGVSRRCHRRHPTAPTPTTPHRSRAATRTTTIDRKRDD